MYYGIKRKVFVSFHQGDRAEVDAFITHWSTNEGVFTPKVLGASDNDDFIDSTNPDYVMNQIRAKYLGDSSITIVLLGACTHSRRYVDWEIKSSLRQGTYTPNGLLGILLPSQGTDGVHLPPRLQATWTRDEADCYARYRSAPASADQLGGWIEDAFTARTSRAHLIENSANMMAYNAQCNVCGITH